MNPLIFVGTYSQRGSAGIYTYALDVVSGALTLKWTTPARNPSFLALSPDGRFLYAANEVGPDGAATAYRIEADSLVDLGAQPTLGHGPCHVEVDPAGRWLLAAHYGDGTHASLPIRGDGSLGPAAHLVTNAGTPGPGQTHGHSHSTRAAPDGKTLYACDLGLDRMIVYELDAESGVLSESGGVDLPPGAGPRHLALHPGLPIAYVICELDSTISAIHLDSGRIAQTLSTLPIGCTGRSVCADIHLRADSCCLYASNRGHDSLATFTVGPDGLLSLAGHTPTGGKCPRNFAVLPNDLILVANQESDNIVAFHANPSSSSKEGTKGGFLFGSRLPVPTGAVTSVPAPACVLYRP